MNEIHLRLPWPPSVNHSYRYSTKTKSVYKTKKVKKYQLDACASIKQQMSVQNYINVPISTPVHISMMCTVPDRRRRDEDNIQKAINDTLVMSNILSDDSLIDEKFIRIERKNPIPGGCVDIVIRLLEE